MAVKGENCVMAGVGGLSRQRMEVVSGRLGVSRLNVVPNWGLV